MNSHPGVVLRCEDVSGFCMGHLATWPRAAEYRCGDEACFAEKYRWHRAHRSEAAWISCLAWRLLDYVQECIGCEKAREEVVRGSALQCATTGYALLLGAVTTSGEWWCAHGIPRHAPLTVALLEVVPDVWNQPRSFVNVLLVVDRARFTAVALDPGHAAARLVQELPWHTLLPEHEAVATGGAVDASGTFAPLMWLHAALEPRSDGAVVDVVRTVAESIKPRTGSAARACPGSAGFELLLLDSFVPPGGTPDMVRLLRGTEARREDTLRGRMWQRALYANPSGEGVAKAWQKTHTTDRSDQLSMVDGRELPEWNLSWFSSSPDDQSEASWETGTPKKRWNSQSSPAQEPLSPRVPFRRSNTF